VKETNQRKIIKIKSGLQLFSFREKCQKKRGVDYLNEVPFEKKPAPGMEQ